MIQYQSQCHPEGLLKCLVVWRRTEIAPYRCRAANLLGAWTALALTRCCVFRSRSTLTSLFVVADVPSKSHLYCVESSGSLPDVRLLPTDPGAEYKLEMLLTLGFDLIRKKGPLQLPLLAFRFAEAASAAAIHLQVVLCNPL